MPTQLILHSITLINSAATFHTWGEVGWGWVQDNMGMGKQMSTQDGQGMDLCSSVASGCQSSHTHFFLKRADANPMVWIVFLEAKLEIPNPDLNALDPGHFPLLCHLTDSTLRLRSFKAEQLSFLLLCSHTVHRWSTQQHLLYRRGHPRRLKSGSML